MNAPSERAWVTAATQAPSIKTVAKSAGVSVATVSRVLNGSGAVRAETRAVVQQAIDALGYQTNHLARNLRRAMTGLILVTVPDLRNPFYARVVEGITRRLQQSNYHMLLCDTSDRGEHLANHLQLIQQRKADGAICLDPYTVHRSIAEELHDLPWVACCEYDEHTQVPHVGIDNAAAARDAVNYLVARGHRRIALINYDERFLFARQRRAGYEQALVGAGLALDPALVRTAEGLGYDEGASVVQRLCLLPAPPTAVFAVSDTLAIGALRGARAAGLAVPRDLAIVGFDDIDFAAQTDPALTTVAQPMNRLGRAAAGLLLQRLLHPDESAPSETLAHELRVRGSA